VMTWSRFSFPKQSRKEEKGLYEKVTADHLHREDDARQGGRREDWRNAMGGRTCCGRGACELESGVSAHIFEMETLVQESYRLRGLRARYTTELIPRVSLVSTVGLDGMGSDSEHLGQINVDVLGTGERV